MAQSAALHVAMLLVALAFGSVQVPKSPLVIDLSLEDAAALPSAPEPETPAPDAPRPVAEQQTPPPPEPEQVLAAPPLPAPVQAAPALSESASAAPVAAEPASPRPAPAVEAPRRAPPPAASHEAVGHAPAPTPVQVARATPEEMRAKYMKERFAYIRDIVQKKAAYPAVARRLGWEGKVTVAFVVDAEGGVRDVRVASSSGRSMLDDSAAEAVRKAAPFPPPPVEAELVMPIVFKLN